MLFGRKDGIFKLCTRSSYKELEISSSWHQIIRRESANKISKQILECSQDYLLKYGKNKTTHFQERNYNISENNI